MTASQARQARYRERHPERVKENNLRSHLKRHYGITPAQYNAMLDAQNGVCAICFDVNADGERLCVDHDHATGAIRGLLCADCNTSLGKMKDDAARLRSAISYLERHANRK